MSFPSQTRDTPGEGCTTNLWWLRDDTEANHLSPAAPHYVVFLDRLIFPRGLPECQATSKTEPLVEYAPESGQVQTAILTEEP